MSKYHKVEMFHSKISRKKKLCLDSNVLNEFKGGNEFNYSFKIEKHYFNVIQSSGSDNFEMRIDNRTFSQLMEEEKFKPKNDSSQSVR